MKTSLRLVIASAVLSLSGGWLFAQQPNAQERVVALKETLEASQAILKGYEWDETIVISLNGEEKSRRINKCSYGADGKVQRIPMTSPPPAEKMRGLRGRIMEAKKEQMTGFMKNVVALVKEYVPPKPDLIEKAKVGGKVSVSHESGERARLVFADYLKPGDSFTLVVDVAKNRPVEARIATYADSKEDTVNLDVRFGTIEGGATHASNVMLDVPSKKVQVAVENSGYRRK